MPVEGRVRSSAFRYKNLEEAINSPVLQKAHRQVNFEDTVFTSPPVVGVTVAGHCRGWRKHMEDRSRVGTTPENGVLVVLLDGHRGEQAVVFCADTLPQAILDNIKDSVRKEPSDPPGNGSNIPSGGGGGGMTSSGIKNNSDSEPMTRAVEIFAGDPQCVTRRDAFVRAFVETDAQLFDLQGGATVYYAEPRESSTLVTTGADSWTMRTPETRQNDHDNEGLSGMCAAHDSLAMLEAVGVSGSGVYNDTNTNNNHESENMLEDSVNSIVNTTREPPSSSGATAVAALVDATHITVSNLGDCRAFIIERRAHTTNTTPPSDITPSASPSSSSTVLSADAVHTALPAGVYIRNAAVPHRPTHHRREAARLSRQFGSRVVMKGRVLGTLMVTRAFGDFDVKFGMTASADAELPEGFAVPPTAVRIPHHRLPTHHNNTHNHIKIAGEMPPDHRDYYHDDITNTLSEDDGYDDEVWESPLLVSNIPHTRVWRRAQLPRPPPAGWNAADIVPYDLIALGSDGTWELHGVTTLANRADAALQPLFQDWHQRLCRNEPEEEERGQAAFAAAIESTLKKIVTETLQAGISNFSTKYATVPGSDNMSLALILLL